ncbi:MAG: YggS family pyridoxal phosphate-dependent enzyme [Chloroflexi bacterium]|nr:YggS family pyridoxal phosphate-dependent enzyme [Chloroflexota bacterium]MDA1240601.1 YggS family pyridoxal phosphate-dependent enzyme [Chloroflexota bacterium]MQC19253.1 YggS family pyridoxal phosphate-dependent enzyme [Chloroflexota bacterium]
MTRPIPSTPSPRPDAGLAERIEAIRARIAQACERSGRNPAEVTLVAVSKGHPATACVEAISAGTVDLGENRAQELLPKAAEVASIGAASGASARWHFIGHLQTNKVRDVLPHTAVFHALDSRRLLDVLTREAARSGAAAAHPLPCYLEVNVAGEAQKEGIAPAQVGALLSAAAASQAVRVEGLMAVAPQVSRPEEVRPVFRALRELAQAHGLTGLSMGMTEDFEVAVEEGATLVRVGRAIFGERTG